MRRVTFALVHYPCVDKQGELYATSITNLDVHDIARSARTYDVTRYYVVHPISAQRELGEAIAGFWQEEKAKRRNPDRTEALGRVRVTSTIEEAIQKETEAGFAPYVVATSARPSANVLSFSDGRALCDERPVMLVFGTGHGLAPSVLELSDAILAPVQPEADYNHLSVRAAAAIILDRLLGER